MIISQCHCAEAASADESISSLGFGNGLAETTGDDIPSPSSLVRGNGELMVTNRVQLELMRGVLERGVPFRFQVLGFSMPPFIQHGDILTIAPLALRAPRVGDVIAFTQTDTMRLAVHRVIAEQVGAYVARGNNCLEANAMIPRANVLGIVTRVERDGRAVELGPGWQLIAWLNASHWFSPLKQLFYLPRRPASKVLRRLQRLPRYRAWIKRFRPAFTIQEAGARDLIEVHARLNPGDDAMPPPQAPDAINFVAKHGDQLLGFVQFVRHPQEHFPYVGNWLFSLIVWGRYRGMGVGETLTRRVIEQATAEGAPELFLNVDDDNRPALDLYRKLGFERVVLPVLEEEFIAEGQRNGRRRVTLRKRLSVNIHRRIDNG
jgi:ribosomal protein S18 acetylase RimI-like enzyme